MKIAVCFSGETRTFNEETTIQERWGIFESLLTQSGDHSVEYYGHTWEHCEPPVFSYIDDVKLTVTDQAEIDEWVADDLIWRTTYKQAWRYDTDYQQMNASQRHDHYLAMSRCGYGQVVSTVKCLNSIDHGKFDLIIKTRWDVELQDGYIESLVKTVQNIYNEVWPAASGAHEGGYLMNSTVSDWATGTNTDSTPEDYLFILQGKSEAHQAVTQMEWKEIISDTLNWRTDDSTPTSHSLWALVFQKWSLKTLSLIDHNIAQISRRQQKINKWDI